jgi:5-methylcytosine-specific restriction endonuclease McrA
MVDVELLNAARAAVEEIRQADRRKSIEEGRPLFRTWSIKELMELDPDPLFFTVDRAGGSVHLYWGGYDYELDLADIRTPMDLLRILSHVATKEWELSTGYRIHRLIERICRARGWDLYSHSDGSPANVKAERAKMTPQLRWRVFARDGHRCKACGSSPANGAILHVDHIQAIANGGLTEMENLQTLCAACNFGKGTS